MKSLDITVANSVMKKIKEKPCICMRSARCSHLSVVTDEIEVDAINGPGNSLKGASVDMCY